VEPGRSEPPAGRQFEPAADREFGPASRRTYLAQERTLLAWWRTGLATVAVALAIGRLLPAVAKVPRTPYLWLGAGFGVLALTLIVFGTLRQRLVNRALDQGGFAGLPTAVVLLVTAFMTTLTLGAIVLLFVGK
jgi:putative membrane protein